MLHTFLNVIEHPKSIHGKMQVFECLTAASQNCKDYHETAYNSFKSHPPF